MFEIGEWVRCSLGMLGNLASKCVVGLCFCSGASVGADVSLAQPSGVVAKPSGVLEQGTDANHLRGQGQSEKQQGGKLLDRQVLRNGSLQDDSGHTGIDIEVHDRCPDFDFRYICREISPLKANPYFLRSPFLVADVKIGRGMFSNSDGDKAGLPSRILKVADIP